MDSDRAVQGRYRLVWTCRKPRAPTRHKSWGGWPKVNTTEVVDVSLHTTPLN